MGIHYTYKSIRGEKAMKKEHPTGQRIKMGRSPAIPYCRKRLLDVDLTTQRSQIVKNTLDDLCCFYHHLRVRMKYAPKSSKNIEINWFDTIGFDNGFESDVNFY